MADPSDSHGGTPDDTGTPRWVKIFGAIALALALLFALFLAVGGRPGGHGPGRHTSSADPGNHPPLTVAVTSVDVAGSTTAAAGQTP